MRSIEGAGGIQRQGEARLDVEFFVEIFNNTVKGLTCWGADGGGR